MKKRAVVTIGLGYGDEGKGTCVEYLARGFLSDLVVRYSGGCQAAHYVVLPDGRSHCFSQFGSGTFSGCRTWLHKNVIINPEAMVNEAIALEFHGGIKDPWSKLFIHPKCLVTTQLHIAANRFREYERGNNRHGSCGMGIGECRERSLANPESSIRAEDLFDARVLETKLTKLRKHYIREFHDELILAPNWLIIQKYQTIRDNLQLTERITSNKTVIFEGAQGLLLDETVGVQPYTTWSDITLNAATQALKDLEIEEVFNLGITRSFATRHGPGPFSTEVPDADLAGDHNRENYFQGKFRLGRLDLGMLSFAAKNAGATLDGVAITWMDSQPTGCKIDAQDCIEQVELATNTRVCLMSYGPTWMDKRSNMKLLRLCGSGIEMANAH